MLPFLNSNKPIGLIDKQTGNIKVVDKLNIILTPSYYWVKRSFLEVKLSSSALKYAPSIFEGYLPEGNFAYYVVKEKEGFVFFAYEPDVILSSLKEKGIGHSDISGIYFAENEMKDISEPISCNTDEVLVLEDNTILQVKKYLVDESSIKRTLDEVKQLSKYKITLHKSSVTHSVKELKPLIAVLSVLILLFAAQVFFTYSQKQELENKPSVFKEYKLPSTFVQNSSIEKKLRKSFKAQMSFRKLVSAILKLPLSQRQRISSLIYEKEAFKITFEADDYARLRDVELHLKKALGKLVKIEIKKNIMKVKIK